MMTVFPFRVPSPRPEASRSVWRAGLCALLLLSLATSCRKAAPSEPESVPEAAAQFHPRAIFFSHLLEMGHCKPGPYRPIAFADAYQDIRAMARRQLAVRSFLPLWGERFVLPLHPFD